MFFFLSGGGTVHCRALSNLWSIWFGPLSLHLFISDQSSQDLVWLIKHNSNPPQHRSTSHPFSLPLSLTYFFFLSCTHTRMHAQTVQPHALPKCAHTELEQKYHKKLWENVKWIFLLATCVQCMKSFFKYALSTVSIRPSVYIFICFVR